MRGLALAMAAAASLGLGAMATIRGEAAGVAWSDPASPAGMRGLELEEELSDAAALIMPCACCGRGVPAITALPIRRSSACVLLSPIVSRFFTR
jgi:hypothetical protein